MTPKIEDHDFSVKTKNAERFLRDGDKVKSLSGSEGAKSSTVILQGSF